MKENSMPSPVMAQRDIVGNLREDVFHEVALDLSAENDYVLDINQEGFIDYSHPSHALIIPHYVPKRGLLKYRKALKHLLPLRKEKKKNVIQVDNAGFFSLVTFSWLSQYVYQAYKSGLTFDDLPQCSPYDACDLNTQRLALFWQDELRKKGPVNASFGKVVWRFIRTRLLIACFIFIISCIIGFINPIIFMRKLIQYSEDPQASTLQGLTWAILFTCCELFRTLALALSYSISYRTAIRLRAACLGLIFRKLIRINSLGAVSLGEIINLYGNDGARLYNMVIFGPMIVGGPIVVLCCACYIYFTLGYWALLGMSAFLLFYPFQYLLSRLTGYFKEESIHKTDERIKIMTEILNTIKLIKMYAWEPFFLKLVHGIREKELSSLRKSAYCQSVGISLAPTIPVISGILIFIIHVLSGGNLTADQAYPLVTLLHAQLRTSLLNLRYGTENIIDGIITFNRMKGVLMLEEAESYVSRPADEEVAISITEASFTWSNKSNDDFHRKNIKANVKKDFEKEELTKKTDKKIFELLSISIYVPKGSLIGICGAVGSGKSSLIQACLGQMKMTSGNICKSGKCAYVSQEAWIKNGTLKENIIFGEPFDPEKYMNTLYYCALNDDLNFLPAGDETEIGERGVNLSGGQKQRISLARAFYSNRDIYFLDNPLSAVDSRVAAHIFEKCILGGLKKKTVFLVTHEIKYLQKCHEILVMKDGKIVERGNHHELLSKEREYKFMVESSALNCDYKTAEENESGKENDYTSNGLTEMKNTQTCDLLFAKKELFAEEQIKGEVKAFAYHSYIKAAGGNLLCFMVFMSICINVASTAFSNWWLAIWIKAGSGNTSIVDPLTNETVISTHITDNPNLNFYIQIYGGLIAVICFTSLLRGVTFTKMTIRASRTLHKDILEKYMSGRLRFFEMTPVGQIHNIFSRDLGEVDCRLPNSMETVIQNMWLILLAFLFITFVFPWFLLVLFVLSTLYYVMGKIFRVAIRDLKRIEAIRNGPIFSMVSATVSGLPIIHAFNKETDFLLKFCKKYDENSVCMYMSCCVMRWMAVRLDCLSVVIALIISVLIIILKGQVAPALAGLALVYSCHISGIFQYTLRLMTETEARFISVERMLISANKIDREMNSEVLVEISPEWPSQGCITFKNVSLKYSKELPAVLNGVSFTVKSGEKIGIVGRTGAGKSSLVAALFRLVELSEGVIFVDGIDISRIPLQTLRSRLSVIPQDPVIFSGSLRSNLDPFNKYCDDAVWEVIKQTKLITKVQSMSDGLSTVIGDCGDNLSVGESQLLCLARALLENSKILVLDEATASIDPDTETVVQSILNEKFNHCTILMIAHRLATVKNCEKVLVIEHGMVQEYDSPNKLLENENSFFTKMVNALK